MAAFNLCSCILLLLGWQRVTVGGKYGEQQDEGALMRSFVLVAAFFCGIRRMETSWKNHSITDGKERWMDGVDTFKTLSRAKTPPFKGIWGLGVVKAQQL